MGQISPEKELSDLFYTTRTVINRRLKALKLLRSNLSDVQQQQVQYFIEDMVLQ